jgi:hypothetical protein
MASKKTSRLVRRHFIGNIILHVQLWLGRLLRWWRLGDYTLDRKLEIEVDVEASTRRYTVHKLLYLPYQLLQAFDVPPFVNF